MNGMELLRNNAVFWSKLGFCYDPPRLGKDGKPIVFFDNWDKVMKYHRDFYNAGIKLHTCILFTGWVGVDTYDYELTDRVLDSIFACGGDDLLFIPRIKLNVPIEWEKANPEELCVYYDGPRNAEEIRALIDTPKHDLLGYQSAKGYYTAGGWQDDRPNLGGVISNQSFSSKKWLRDAGEALRRLIRHIEDGPYGNRIPAYHIAYGVSGETCVWGRCNVNNSADYGISNRKNFFQWGMKKYGDVDALRAAWCQPEMTEENIVLPAPDHKEGKIGDMAEFLRQAPADRICTDYDLFATEVNVDAMEHFGKIVKNETRNKPVGVFYGYFLGVARSTYTGYVGLERVLKSPYVDFIAAPKRDYNGGCGEACTVQSVNRAGKLWMDELDNRTFIATGTGFESKSSGMSETKAIMWREFAKNISHGSSFWWMDLGGGWYDHPELLSEISRIEGAAAQFRSMPAKSISEILLVADDDVFHYHKTSYYLHSTLFANVIDSMNSVGAPYDFYRMSDLETLDVSGYKMVIFINPFRLERAKWQRVAKRFGAHTTLLYYYAPGVNLDDEVDSKHIQELFGFQVTERKDNDYQPLQTTGPLQGTPAIPWLPHTADDHCPVADNVPVYEIVGDAAKNPLALYSDGAVAIAENRHDGRRTIFAAAPLLQSHQLRRIAEESGCRLYAPEGVLVYGDTRFLAFFTWKDAKFTLELPEGQWLEVVGNSSEIKSGTVELTMPEKNTSLWVKK